MHKKIQKILLELVDELNNSLDYDRFEHPVAFAYVTDGYEQFVSLGNDVIIWDLEHNSGATKDEIRNELLTNFNVYISDMVGGEARVNADSFLYKTMNEFASYLESEWSIPEIPYDAIKDFIDNYK